MDRTTPLQDQARAVAAAFHPSRTLSGYGENGSFTKLREVSLTYTVPDTWAGALGAERLALTVSGRNLKTWTDFGGLDPELNATGQSNFQQTEFFTQGPPRYWTLRLGIDF